MMNLRKLVIDGVQKRMVRGSHDRYRETTHLQAIVIQVSFVLK